MLNCQKAVGNHSADHWAANILSPSDGTIEMSPSLGVVVNQLKSTVDYHNKQKSNYKNSLDLTVRTNYEEVCERMLEKQEESVKVSRSQNNVFFMDSFRFLYGTSDFSQ
uniref:Uncharacterized protein n=1 Tax=Megaselia scalaris TaxID=36166 RepID=T1GCY9_MEGSC